MNLVIENAMVYVLFCRYVHIVVNLAFQLLLGLPLEMVHKWWRVSLLYFAGVIAGSLATSITDPWVRLAGASGGVYSLLTAHIATIVMVCFVYCHYIHIFKSTILELE